MQRKFSQKKLLIVKTPDFSKRPPPKLGCAFILYTAETSKEFLLPGLSWIAPQDFPIKLHYCISHFPASGTACGDISQMHQEKRTKLSKSCCLIYQKSRSYFWHMWPREYPTVCPAGHKLIRGWWPPSPAQLDLVEDICPRSSLGCCTL